MNSLQMSGPPDLCGELERPGHGEVSHRTLLRERKRPHPAPPHGYLALRTELISRPESVTLVRTLLRTVAREVGIGSALLDDLCTAVSEACNNVVLHAYPGVSGPLIFSCTVRGGSVDVVVSDRGCGIAAASREASGLGLGLTVIRALAAKTEFDSRAGSGTKVRLTFRCIEEVSRAGAAQPLSPWRLPTADLQESGRQASGVRLAR